jgi:hypothetical protein
MVTVKDIYKGRKRPHFHLVKNLKYKQYNNKKKHYFLHTSYNDTQLNFIQSDTAFLSKQSG